MLFCSPIWRAPNVHLHDSRTRSITSPVMMTAWFARVQHVAPISLWFRLKQMVLGNCPTFAAHISNGGISFFFWPPQEFKQIPCMSKDDMTNSQSAVPVKGCCLLPHQTVLYQDWVNPISPCDHPQLLPGQILLCLLWFGDISSKKQIQGQLQNRLMEFVQHEKQH